MVTISLDEYGEFEKDIDMPMFIAGFLYDDMEKDTDPHTEEYYERERIRAYYRSVIQDAGEGFSYPEDLHSNGDSTRDHNVVAPVKTRVTETLPEFIQEGTYQGKALVNEKGQKLPKRKGQYHLFVMLKSDEGKKRLLTDHASIFAKDDIAANRYFHMAGSVVNRIIFHNPLFEAGSTPTINIDIATRSTGRVDDLDEDLQNEFKKQAYRPNSTDNPDYKYYSIMNSEIYRTLISQEMVGSDNIGIKIDKLYVKSIQYQKNKSMMEFLYLSDSICSMLAYQLPEGGADAWLTEIIRRCNEINPENANIIFGYDEADNDFAKAWTYYERKEYFEALSCAYDASVKDTAFARHYAVTWYPYLESSIQRRMDPLYFNKCINELSSMLTINNLDQEKLIYLFEQFERMVPAVAPLYHSNDMRSRDLYKLYDVGVSAYCHGGDAGKAMEYYEKCKEYAFYVGVDAYLRTNNKLVVCLEDRFEWEKGLELAKENVENQQLASEMKRSILGNGNEEDFLDEAKSVSQMARILAEMRNPKAEELFRAALSKLETGSANYKITQSYLLHYYADMGLKEMFDDESMYYFDGKRTANQRFKYLTGAEEEIHSAFSNEYAMYVLIRGLYLFHKDEIDDAFWGKLCQMQEILEKKDGKTPSGHPWEIIYKYMELLAIERQDFEAKEKFSSLRESALHYKGDILYALEQFGLAEVAAKEDKIADRDRITLELAHFMNETFTSLQNRSFSPDGLTRYREMEQYFTFMYH